MEKTKSNRKRVDVICLHSRDAAIVPLRIRLIDEDGQYQAFVIKEYRDLSHQGTRTMPDGVYVTDNTLIYECKISVLGRDRIVRLYYEIGHFYWEMTD